MYRECHRGQSGRDTTVEADENGAGSRDNATTGRQRARDTTCRSTAGQHSLRSHRDTTRGTDENSRDSTDCPAVEPSELRNPGDTTTAQAGRPQDRNPSDTTRGITEILPETPKHHGFTGNDPRVQPQHCDTTGRTDEEESLRTSLLHSDEPTNQHKTTIRDGDTTHYLNHSDSRHTFITTLFWYHWYTIHSIHPIGWDGNGPILIPHLSSGGVLV